MNFYENVVIFDPSLSDEDQKSLSEKIVSVIQSAGGQLLKIDPWGRRKLAYELNKQKMGIYVLYLFKAPSTAIKKLEEFYKVTDNVIKFMVIRLGKHEISALPADVLAQESPKTEDTTREVTTDVQ